MRQAAADSAGHLTGLARRPRITNGGWQPCEAAKGVAISRCVNTLRHKLPRYQEAESWFPKPTIPELHGCEQANQTCMVIRCFTKLARELIDQCVEAFEKVRAHRAKPGKA